MPKRNGFFMFMSERRPGLVAAGHALTRGWAEIAEMVSDEWQALPPEVKEKYSERADRFNERRRGDDFPTMKDVNVHRDEAKAAAAAEDDGQDWVGIARAKVEVKKQVAATIMAPLQNVKDEKCLANRQYVFDMFLKNTWTTQPIVVCIFTTYFDHKFDGVFLPAEFGLASFSLMEGLIDNYGRILDPGKIPKGRGAEALKTIENLGVPSPGSVPEFAELESTFLTLESYLEKHRGNFGTEEYYVFAFDSDYELVTRCFEWFSAVTGHLLPIRVLSLTLYAHLASTHANPTIRNTVLDVELMSQEPKKNLEEEEEEEKTTVTANVSPYRVPGQPLNASFVYSPTYPMLKYGLFMVETEVEDFVKQTDNYKYYDELCCVYHFKTREGIQNCALNIVNRYVYNLLEILTMSNAVEIIPGAHVPQVDDPKMESDRRQSWLVKWGVTKHELEMEDPPDSTATVVEVRRVRQAGSAPFDRFRRFGNRREMAAQDQDQIAQEEQNGSGRENGEDGQDEEDVEEVLACEDDDGEFYVSTPLVGKPSPYTGIAPSVYRTDCFQD